MMCGMNSIEEILNILESAKDDTGSVPMRLVRQAFDKLLGSCEDAVSRREAIVAVEKESQVDGAYGYMDTKSIVDLLNDLPSAEPEIKPISYQDCANAMLIMWMDNVVTDGEYNRIMDKLNAYFAERREE